MTYYINHKVRGHLECFINPKEGGIFKVYIPSTLYRVFY